MARTTARPWPLVGPSAWLLACALAWAPACGGGDEAELPRSAAPDDAPRPSAEEAADAPLVVFLGDSLSAAHELDESDGFPALIEARLRADGLSVEVVNAGVSGDTSAGGLARIDWILRQDPDVVVVELGGNDGLRGVPVESTERNLRAILERLRAAGVQPLLCAMRLPPNYGPDYVAAFEALYPRLAEELDVPLAPFLLEGVAAVPELNLPDGLHPNAAGQRVVAENLLPHVRALVEDALAEE